MFKTVIDLHDMTQYKALERNGMNMTWLLAVSFTEGCSTSPILFNIYHLTVL